MSVADRKENREPLIHLSRRISIPRWKAWGIRLAAVLLGFLFCGLVAFLLIDRLQQNPGKIGQFYMDFLNGAFGSNRKLWKFMKDIAVMSDMLRKQ